MVKIKGVAYLEGCFKSNKYGSGFLMNNVIVYIVLKLLIINGCSAILIVYMYIYTVDESFYSPTGPYAWLVFSSISSLGDTSS